MPRYLIQHAHDADPFACARVVEAFLRTGSHYLTHADWGCRDGDHTAWLIVEALDRDEARRVVPAPFQTQSRVVRLHRFTLEGLAESMRHHRRQQGTGPLPSRRAP